MTLATCTRRGCGQSFDPEQNGDADCSFHPGAPVFHEGLKSWSCCSDVNKPVTDFDDFMKLPTCATGSHSLEPAEPLNPVAEASKAPSTTDADGKEVYGAAVPQDSTSEDSSLPPLPPGPKIAHKEGPQKPQSTQYVAIRRGSADVVQPCSRSASRNSLQYHQKATTTPFA
ncbi:hypothetical protein NBRC10513_004547 [Rhodotorula toruloides]